jgi:hypothetical protein
MDLSQNNNNNASINIHSSVERHHLPSLHRELRPFASDPVRSDPLSVSQEVIQAFFGPHFLSMALVDFILQNALKDEIRPDLLIGISNSMPWFKMMNDKKDPEEVLRLREKYRPYSSGRFQFLVANCHLNHFICLQVTFDIGTETIFDNIVLYDSMKGSSRQKTELTKTVLVANS